MGQAEGFEWPRRKNGDVVIAHHGRVATTLRGDRADQFVEDVVDGDEQELMARLTGKLQTRQRARRAEAPTKSGTAVAVTEDLSLWPCSAAA